jgi:hypothetical protein
MAFVTDEQPGILCGHGVANTLSSYVHNFSARFAIGVSIFLKHLILPRPVARQSKIFGQKIFQEHKQNPDRPDNFR